MKLLLKPKYREEQFKVVNFSTAFCHVAWINHQRKTLVSSPRQPQHLPSDAASPLRGKLIPICQCWNGLRCFRLLDFYLRAEWFLRCSRSNSLLKIELLNVVRMSSWGELLYLVFCCSPADIQPSEHFWSADHHFKRFIMQHEQGKVQSGEKKLPNRLM